MTGSTYVGAIDQGTTGTRFMVFDHAGQVVANAYEKHEQIYPEPGWVEHDPVEIWENCKTVITRALSQADLGPDQLAAIGVTNQRETTLLWDADSGKPVYNAIVWQDRRTTDRVEQLQAEDKVEWIRGKTGLEADAYFSATKVEWLLENADPIKLERTRPQDVLDDRARLGHVRGARDVGDDATGAARLQRRGEQRPLQRCQGRQVGRGHAVAGQVARADEHVAGADAAGTHRARRGYRSRTVCCALPASC